MSDPNQEKITRRGFHTIHTLGVTDVDEILGMLESGGEVLKSSHKSVTRRVGDWVVKRSRWNKGIGPVKHTVLRQRYRQAWNAARHLQAHGVPVAPPRAFVETGAFGFIVGNTLVTEYLEGCVNIEEHLCILKENAGDAGIEGFLSRLADAVRGIEHADAVQEDFAGANILTRNGKEVFFVDLDAVRIHVPYTEDLRALNHAQLWLSLSYSCSDEQIHHFLDLLKPTTHSLDEWVANVRIKFEPRLANANAMAAARAAARAAAAKK